MHGMTFWTIADAEKFIFDNVDPYSQAWRFEFRSDVIVVWYWDR